MRVRLLVLIILDAMDKETRLILVGGFLGSGKTTLIYEVTKHFMKEGKRVGLITNDQASELVDTALLLQTNAKVSEVSGSCFCCNYDGFIDSLKQVKRDSQTDIIIAEPVGSCTDLSATIMQPLKDQFNKELTISPLSVLADPWRIADILDGRNAGLHPSAAYIFKKQLEESDIILISKSDLLESDQLEFLKREVKRCYSNSIVLSISSKSGDGITEWIQAVSESTKIGNQIVEVDYDTYAEGEAVLGWLNASVIFNGNQVKWDAFVASFLKELGQQFDSLDLSVGHVKVILDNGKKYIRGNITGKAETMQIKGAVDVSNEAKMIINARVETSPNELERLVKQALTRVTNTEIEMKINAWKCLSPGYPKPTYRYDSVFDNV